MRKTQNVPATLKAISSFTTELEDFFAPLPLEVRVNIVLSVQELCVNIVEHAYANAEGNIAIDIDWSSDKLEIHFRDNAPNHFTLPQTIELPDPRELTEGGLGLFIIYEVFDEVQYAPLQSGNHWYLSKQLEA